MDHTNPVQARPISPTDTLINDLTGILALVFFGGVTLLQAVFSSYSGEQSSLVVALSTLAIAALFNPLRS